MQNLSFVHIRHLYELKIGPNEMWPEEGDMRAGLILLNGITKDLSIFMK